VSLAFEGREALEALRVILLRAGLGLRAMVPTCPVADLATPSGPGPRGSRPRRQGPGCRRIHPARPAPTRLAFPVPTTSVLGSPIDIPLLEPLPGIPSPPIGARPHARPSSGRTAHLKTGALPNDASSPFPADRAPAEDRKSTRLNSSHVKISYAVFCLKKKKKTTASQIT